MPSDIYTYLLTSGKQIVYSNDEIQARDSVFCGYWCLYYMLERQKGRSVLETRVSTIDSSNSISEVCIMVRSYCVKQKNFTECVPGGGERYERAKNGRLMLRCKCAKCGITKVKFVKNKEN